MSEHRQSTAAVIRVKGVSFNYLQFLWSSIATIKRTQEQGKFAEALGLATELIAYLPESMKEDFTQKAEAIRRCLNLITTGKLPQIQKIPDFYLRGIFKNRLLQNFGSKALDHFVKELTTKLDNIGYMENTKVVAEGDTDQTGQNWLELQDKQGKPSGRRKKKSDSPSGEVD